YNSPGGSPHLGYTVTAIATQTFLSTTRSTNVNARFTASYWENKSDTDKINLSHTATVRKTSSPDSVIPGGTFHYINKPKGVAAETTKVGPNSTDIVLEANTSYIVHLLYSIDSEKSVTTRIWLDDISCNVSPSGLYASETSDPVSGSARGKCRLNWSTSTGTIGLAASPYRVYCSYISENGPWTQIATITTATTTYLASPTMDIAWYAVSDVDTAGIESPLSLPVSYRAARLQITKVETTTTNVTKGQSGLPVKVYITNTGSNSASIGSAELLFDSAGNPANGDYSIGAPSPALPLTLAGGDSTTLTFLVDVGINSVSGVDSIDAKVTGTNSVTLHAIADNESDIKATWQIQEPPNLKILDITASPTVYLDQTGAGIYITVRNDGEAAAVWDLWNDTELHFERGTYLNQRPYGVPNPYSEIILTGQTKIIRFDIDISPLSATGTTTINASMSYIDGNTYDSFRYDLGDTTPPSWTIRSGILKTYRGPIGFPAWTIESSSFNLGNFTVYTKGMNLQPDRDYRMRWYRPDTLQEQADMVSTDLDGILTNSFTLSDNPLYSGKWRVIVSRVTNEIPLCETYFDVVDPASLSIQLLVPDFVTVSQPFQISSRLVNAGGSRVDTAYASTFALDAGNTGTAAFNSGPSSNNVTVEPYSYTDITWNYTAATTGRFAVRGSGFGIDSNDLRFLTAATQTSNICTIQAPPALTVTGVNAAATEVYLNQQNLMVTMVVTNTGSASIWLNIASLTFNPGTHFQTLESPAMPYLLASNTPTTFTYRVSVATNSATGVSTIGGYAAGIDANWPTSPAISKASTASDSWNINGGIVGYCAIDPGFTMEQYTLNVNQQVWAKFSGITSTDGLRIIYRLATITANPDGSEPVVSNETKTGDIRIEDYIVPGPAGAWKTELYTMSGKSPTPNTFLARQFFEIQNPGSLTASLTFVPNDIELNDEVTLVLKLSNNVTLGSTIENILPAAPLKISTGSGSLLLLSGPEPSIANLRAGNTASFTWTYRATQHTGPGTMQMIASATGNDANLLSANPGYATSGVALSSPLKIRYRELSYASPTLNFGTMVCGEIKIVGTSKVNNLGSTDLTHTRWNKGFFESELSDLLHPSQLTMYPLSGFTVPVVAPSATSTYAELHMPYNQPAGNYIATMSVFEDMPPYNGVLDAGEPNYVFNSRVIASQCRVVYTLPEIISLGDWKIGNTIATKTLKILNGGNLTLEKLKIKQVTPSSFTMVVTPVSIGNMTLYASQIASISGYINSIATDGEYIIDFIVWEDLNDDGNVNDGRASATFKIEIGIGNQLMHLSPSLIDFGNATPTFPLPEESFKITNIGDKTLNRLKCIINNLNHTTQPGFYIPADEIEFELPASIAVGATETAYINAYIPAGAPIGTYTGTVTIFEDEDSSGTISNDNEAPITMTLRLYVVPYRGLRVLTPIADAGPLSRLETGVATFSARNTGNVFLDALTWEKIILSNSNGNASHTIPITTYDFLPVATFSHQAIVDPFFTCNLILTVPKFLPDGTTLQPDGDYIGQYAWLYDDVATDGRLIGGDPQAPFAVTCQVGTKYIDIVDTELIIADAIPSQLSAATTFTIKNTGTLLLNRPMATASVLIGPVPPIPATASIFLPGVFDYMIANKTLTGTWQVNVPPGTPDGTYIATITVWNDTNGNSRIDDPAEASDTARLELRVIAKTVIGISPTTLDFGTVAPERSSMVSFNIVNLGNMAISSDIREVASWLPPLAAGIPIPAAQLDFNPPFATSLAVGGSAPAVATLTIPAGQATGIYQGTQRAYVDSDVPLGAYTSGEVTATFTTRVLVGNKQISVADVNMGSHAHATTATTNFTLSNTGNINANRIRWIAQNITDGTTTLTPTLGPNASVAAGGTLNCTANVIIPQYTRPGIYTGIQTVFDDDLLPFDNTLNPSKEASDTFVLSLTVATSPGLIITNINPPFPVNVSLGQKVFVDVTFQNTGNVALSDLSWGAPMATMNGSEGDTMVPTFSPDPLPSLAPGATYIASITFEARANQATGTYTGLQTLSSTAYPAATANVAPSILVVSQTGPKDLEKGTVFQNIATETFAAGGDFIFSVYVGFENGLPASGTIGFRQDKTDDTPAVLPISYVTIDQSGNVIEANPAGAGGVTNYIKSGNKTWYRLHLKFSGALNPLTESTYLILSNSSSSTIPKVWFDGVQLERANGRDRPTSFGEGSKIISPSNRTDLEGKSRYSDW
ncbi:MAG TPA: hypothetical protein DCG57_21560, partial [Candidatus Riflebacteria bacterium]|nr:hypothetical protein [Candidatus Riflebacteria bacterium]